MKNKMLTQHKKLAVIIPVILIAIMVLGFAFNTFAHNAMKAANSGNWALLWDPSLIFTLETFLYGAIALTVCVILYLIFAIESSSKKTKRIMKSQLSAAEGGLEK